MAIAGAFLVIYGFGGIPLLRVMTSDGAVVEACRPFLPWLILMPPLGCAAFAWDGIYEGATASRPMRDAMLAAMVAFFALWFALKGFLPPESASVMPGDLYVMPGDLPVMPGDLPVMPGDLPVMPGDLPVMPGDLPVMPGSDRASRSALALHFLMAAYFAHLLVRTVWLTVLYRRSVLDRPFGQPF